MLNLSAAAIIEKNKLVSDSVWIVLLEVKTPDGFIRLASNNVDVKWNNVTWTAFPFIIDTLKYEKDELIEVPVRISNVSRIIEYYVEYYDGLIGQDVTLRVVNSKFLEAETPELEEVFTITSTSTDASWCTFKLGSGFPLRQRFPKHRILKDYCPFAYKGIQCKATSSLPDCPKTLYGCFVRGNQQRFGGEPAMVLGGIYTELTGSTFYPVIHSNSGGSSSSDDNTDYDDSGDDT